MSVNSSNPLHVHRKPIGTRIRLARITADLSQEYVAKKLGISQQAYSPLEKEDHDNVTWHRLREIAEICSMDVDELTSIDKHAIFNRDIKDCKQVGNQHAVYNENSFEEERAVFKAYIQELKEELSYWRGLGK